MQQSYTQQNPNLVYRSSLFSLSTLTIFSCNSTFTQTNDWKLSRIDVSKTIDITANPTSITPELVVQANSLEYGLYKFTFQVNVQTVDNFLTNSISTFIQIIPTGLAVFAVQNGISSLLIGSRQNLILKPDVFSVDLDYLISPNSLQYKIFCSTINTTLSSTVNNVKNIDLLTYKSNSSLKMASNETCFASNSIKN